MNNTFSSSEQQFLELFKVGLWGGMPDSKCFQHTDWEQVVRLAQQQTMTGVVGEAVMNLPEQLVPAEWRMRLLAAIVRIEEANIKMNNFLPVLFRRLSKHGWNVWLLKGQGVGLCYLEPLRRQPGDIDVFFTRLQDYKDACSFFKKNLPESDIMSESNKTMDFEFVVGSLYVEFHGQILTEVNRACHKHFDSWLQQVAKEPGMNTSAWDSVLLPPCHFDAIFIFLHTVRHYFGGGIGLRQVSDWMRYVYTYQEQLDMERLTHDIKHLGLEKIWKVFGCMAVDYLGCPESMMPLYDNRYHKEATAVLRYILNSGNFGYYDASTKTNSKSYLVQRWKAFTGHLQMKLRNFTMFPEESVYGIPSFLVDGISRAINRPHKA